MKDFPSEYKEDAIPGYAQVRGKQENSIKKISSNLDTGYQIVFIIIGMVCAAFVANITKHYLWIFWLNIFKEYYKM